MEPTQQPTEQTSQQFSPEGETVSHTSRNLIVSISALIIVALALGFWWMNFQKKANQEGPAAVRTQIASSDDKLVEGFPKEFLIDKHAGINESKRFTETGGSAGTADVFTVNFTSNIPMTSLANLYGIYLKTNGYTILPMVESKTVTRLFATKGSSTVSVSIKPAGNSSNTDLIIRIPKAK